MSIRPVGKLLVVADPPEEDNGLILPAGVQGPSIGVVGKVGDAVEDFKSGDKVFYRGPTIDIFTPIAEGETEKRITTKLISTDQVVAVEEE